jgi:PAS domain S-box-containing protein
MKKSTNGDYLQTLGISIADHVTAMIAYWDAKLVCRFANIAYRDWFGKTPEQMINKMTLPELLGPALYEKNLPHITEALKGHPQTFEREIPAPGGGVRYSLANYFPYIVNGQTKGFFVHVADISAIKQQEANPALQQEFVSAQNSLLINLADIVSNNLKSYENNLEEILGGFNSGPGPGQQEIVSKLKNISTGFGATATHLNEIIRIQQYSKLKPGYINLHEYINNASNTVKSMLEAEQVIIKNNVSPAIKLLANPVYLENILVKVLTSSIQKNQPSHELIISLDAFLMDKWLILKIKDNGRGVNDSENSGFAHANKEAPASQPADGVGLFVTKFQVESMGGRIEVESSEQKGTTISIYFTLA